MMLRLALRQGPIHKLNQIVASKSRISLGAARDRLLKDIQNAAGDDGNIGGTIAGKKMYINRKMGDRGVRGKKGTFSGFGNREIVHHEGFHSKNPILGQSEILAQFYGGLKSKKGKLTPGRAIGAVGTLALARPDRLMGELALAGGVAYGAKKLYDKLRKRNKDKK